MNGYGSDTTDSSGGGARPRAWSRARHRAAGQQAAFEAVRPGITCQEIDRVGRGVITAAWATATSSSTAPATASSTHEPPYMVEGEAAFGAGMYFSIEPGVYLSGRFGGGSRTSSS